MDTPEDDHLRAETLAAVQVVAAAGVLARNRAGVGDVMLKGSLDLVTATEVAIEETISELLRDAGGLPVAGEERGDFSAASGSAYWIVDPICGTRNFASDIPLYCINVALIEANVVAAAVVGDPSSGEIFVAERGRGAWVVERTGRSLRRIGASGESRTLVIEDSHADRDANRRARAASAVARAIEAFRWDVRAFSTTLALPYLASGRVAAYVLFWTSQIHAAAGSLLATEAGATVSDIDGQPWTLASDSIVAAATPVLHSELLELTQGGARAFATH